MRPLAAALPMLLLWACSDSPPEPRACLATRECEPGERCVSGRCRPREARPCTADGECGPGGACVEALCLGGTACRTAGDCASGESCDPIQGVCALGPCDARGGCPNGGTCNFATNRCGPRRACTRDEQCGPPNGICDGGYCTAGCAKAGCAEGQTCATSGRCGSGPGCTSDAPCGAPARICKAGRCIAGCAHGGDPCSAPATCNPSTGHCEGNGCSNDEQCGRPISVCEHGLCVPGCGQAGVDPCYGGQTCNAATGRCGGGGGGDCNLAGCPSYESCNPVSGACEPRRCGADLECGPPQGRCESGTCVRGCGLEGCAGGGTCAQESGRCSGGGGGIDVRDTPCVKNSDCAGNHCLTPAGGTNGVCADQCSSTSDCGAGLRCWEAPEAPGIKACFGSQHLGRRIGTRRAGEACNSGDECQSGACAGRPNQQAKCMEVCSRDADCIDGYETCRPLAVNPDMTQFVQVCSTDALLVGAFSEFPYACFPDPEFPMSDCSSGACAVTELENGEPFAFCFEPCCSTADCPGGSVCMAQLPFYVALAAVVGISQSQTLMKGCFPAMPNSGVDAVGAPCSLQDGTNCRSNLCIANTLDGASVNPYCSDLCCTNADCPAGYACVSTYDEQSQYSWPLCVRLQ